MDNNYIETLSREEIIRRATAIAGENIELQRTIDRLRGRLRESRRATAYYHAQYRESMRYKFDAEADRTRDQSRRRELAVALVGVSVMITCLLFVGAACWGWHFG